VTVSQPTTFLGDADRHHIIFIFINGVEDRRRRQQGNFMLAATSAEKYSHPEFLHHEYCKAAFSGQQSGFLRSSEQSLAAGCGYFDQAHFIHDFKEFSGIKSTTYLMRKAEHLNQVPMHE